MEGSPDGSAANHSHVSSEAIHAEAKAVQAKFMSNVDTTTEVVIRLDFMTEQNTRVSNTFKAQRFKCTTVLQALSDIPVMTAVCHADN